MILFLSSNKKYYLLEFYLFNIVLYLYLNKNFKKKIKNLNLKSGPIIFKYGKKI